MELAESLALKNGKSAGEFMNYSFRSLKDIAGLQCVDMAGCPIMLDGEISRLHHNLCIPSCGRRNKTSNPEGNGC